LSARAETRGVELLKFGETSPLAWQSRAKPPGNRRKV